MTTEQQVTFEESQSMRRWWVWPAVALGPVRANAALAWLGAWLLLLAARLQTEVRLDGVYYRYRPFFLHLHRIGFDEIESFEACAYRPLLEYGGWGIRWSVLGRGIAFTAFGNSGVRFTLRDGRRRLIGSQRADELAEAVRKGMAELGGNA